MHFPGFRPALFQAHVATWVGGAAEADLVPGKRMSIVGFDGILYQQEPVASHRKLFPDIAASRWIVVVKRLQDSILFSRAKFNKRWDVHMPGNSLDALQSQPVRLTIRRHIFKAVAIDAPAVCPLVDPGNEGNFVRLVAVVLRQNAVANRLHQRSLLRREEAQGRHMLDALQYHLARGFVPELLLRERLKAGIVAGLGARRERSFCRRVNWQATFIYP